MNLAPTVHYPYADISGVVALWAEHCSAMAVFQHGPDEGQASEHCHFYMLDVDCGKENLKKIFHSNFLTFKTRNELWAWTHKDYPVIESLDTSGGLQYLKYMTKGFISAKFLKNISPAKVEEAKALWVNKAPIQMQAPSDKASEFDTILYTLSKKYKEDDHNNITVLQIKRDICHMYLSKRKAVPRMGDLTRYSWSAYMIIRNDKTHTTLSQDIITYLDTESDSFK